MELLFDEDFVPGSPLSAAESQHCVKVLRHRVGDTLYVTDGRGVRYTCRLEEADPRGCLVDVVETLTMPARRCRLRMAVAPTKNTDRFEWFVEKAVELGVERITPLMTERTVRDKMRLSRLTNIVVAACKQSLKYYLPQVDEPMPFGELMREEATEAQKFILHCEPQGASVKPHLFNAIEAGKEGIILIGPEGDFSPSEIETALSHGYTACTLGEERLRTETAAVAATHIFDLKNALS